MNAVERLGSYITKGVYTVAAPFHPFGGAVDIIVVQQQDGTFKSSPWYVKFGKFQGVLKRREKLVTVCVNGEEAGFHMFLDHKGEAYFLREIDHDDDDGAPSAPSSGEDTEDGKRRNKTGGVASEDSGNRRSGNSDEIEVRTTINESNGKMIVRTSSRRSTILGLVLGRRSMKRERKDGSGVDRIDSFERAEIAADLLEVKWSTNLPDLGNEGKPKSSSRLAGSRVHADLGDDQTVDGKRDDGALKVENSGVEDLLLDTKESSDVGSLKLEFFGGDDASSVPENCEIGLTVLGNFCQETPSLVPEDDSLVGNSTIEFEVPASGNLSSVPESGSELSGDVDKKKLGNDRVSQTVIEPCESDTVIHLTAADTDEERELKDGSPSCSDGICPESGIVCSPSCNNEVMEQGTSRESYIERVELHTMVLNETTELPHELTLSDLVVEIKEENVDCVNLKPNGHVGQCHIYETAVAMEEEKNTKYSALDAFGDLVDNGNERLVEYDSAHAEHLEVFQMDDVSENENIEINANEGVATRERGTCLESLKSCGNKTEVIDRGCSFPDPSEIVEVQYEEKLEERFSANGASLSYDVDIEISHRISGPEASSTVTTLSCNSHSNVDYHDLEACCEVQNHISASSPTKPSNDNLTAVESGQIEGYNNFDSDLPGGATKVSDDKINFQVSLHENTVVQEESMALHAIDDTRESTEFNEIHHQSSLSSELTINEFQSSFLADSTIEDYTRESLNDIYDRMHLEDGKRSEAIDIPKVCKHKDDAEQLSKSLPIIRSCISDLESLDLHTLSHSLTSNYELLQMGMLQRDSQSPSENMEDSKMDVEPEQCKPEGGVSVSETQVTVENAGLSNGPAVEISLCKHLLSEGMGVDAASKAFDAEKISFEKFSALGPSILNNDKLIVRINGQYFPWEAAAPIVLGMVSFGRESTSERKGMIVVEPVEKTLDKYQSTAIVPTSGSWRFWPFGKKSRTYATSRSLAGTLDENGSQNFDDKLSSGEESMRRTPKRVQTIVPTSEQLASLNLKEGQNVVTFTFSTAMLGKQQVDARIYLWKWNTRIVVSDVDGTITKSDVLGQFMPLVGKDWSHLGVAHLYSAIKENGYQLLFLSARAISQAYLTRQFLFNLKQDGKALPDGPVVISPDGLFPSLFREVIRRAPHEFKIACLEDIRALFPRDCNPFYAGFGNRDTDEISYRKVGIPKGKIFIINPKGEVAVNRRIDTKSYHSLHSLVNGIFPAMSSYEPEDFNSWNYWKMPLPDISD